MPPNNTDLKAAYCIAREKNTISEFDSLWGKLDTPPQGVDTQVYQTLRSFRSEAAERLNHLQLYLLPRLKFLDAEGLLAANAQATRDAAKLKEPSVASCTAQCQQEIAQKLRQQKGNEAEAMACIKSCSPDVLSRGWACNDLSWLPF